MTRGILFLVLSSAFFALPLHAQTFSNVTAFFPVVHSTVAWADYDNDGDMDLFVTGNGNGRRRILFRNDGNGSFVVATGLGSLTSDIGEDSAVAWGDYDNDGDLDLFIASGAVFNASNGFRDFLYRNNRDGTFTRIFTGSLVNDNG